MGGFGRDGPRQRLNIYLWAFSAGIALFCGRASSSEISDTKAHLVQEGVDAGTAALAIFHNTGIRKLQDFLVKPTPDLQGIDLAVRYV